MGNYEQLDELIKEFGTGASTDTNGSDDGSGIGTGSNANSGIDGSEGTKRRKRRTRAEIESQKTNVVPLGNKKSKEIITEQHLTELIKAGFDMIANVRGPHWSQTVENCEQFGVPLARYLNASQPKVAQAIGDNVIFAAMFIGAFNLLAVPLKVEYAISIQNKQNKSGTTTATTNPNPIPESDTANSEFNGGNVKSSIINDIKTGTTYPD